MDANYKILKAGKTTAFRKHAGNAAAGCVTLFPTIKRTSLIVTLLTVLSFFAGQGLFAQVTIPAANTATSVNRLPLGTFFGFARSSMIYNSTEIGSSGSITAVGFYLQSKNAAGAATNVRIYMKNVGTTASHTSSTYNAAISGATLVYGPTTITAASLIAGSWNTITLATPFSYSGGNLQILVETNASPSGNELTTAKQFRCGPAVTGSFESWQADTTDPSPTLAGTVGNNRPNVQLTITTPPCSGMPAPGNTVASTTTPCYGFSSLLSFQNATSGSGVSYQWYNSAGAISGATSATYATPVTATAATNYYATVTCGGNTGTSTGVTVTPKSYSTFPFLETFDSSSTSLSCWGTTATTGNTILWAYGTGDATHGVSGPAASTQFAFLNVYNASATYNPYALISPLFNLNGANKQLRYKYFLGNDGYKGTTGATGSDPYPLQIQVSLNRGAFTSIYNHSGTNSVFATSSATSNWQSNTLDLSAYAGQSIQLRFYSISNFGSNFCNQGLDEVYVEDIPSCLAPTAITYSALTSASATISWTAPSPAPPGGYQYEVRSSGAAGSGGATASGSTGAGVVTAAVSGLAANTSYTIYVRSVCSGPSYSAWSSGSLYTGYCIPAPSSVDGTGITNVSFGTINNATGAEAGNYGNYSAMTSTQQQGATMPVNITFATGYTYDTKIWIDFNNDLDFGDAGENVYTGVSTSANPTTLAASFTLNASTPLGSHRMRIGAVDAGPPTDCYNGTYGTYEDYTINVIAAVTDTPDYFNLQVPSSATILSGGSATVYGQVYEAGLTNTASGQAPGIQAWIGISPVGSNTNPNTWTTWIPATFNVEVGNNDEYMANIGSSLTVGTYYYATRWSLNTGPYVYGGYPNGAWNGTTQNSGVLTVNANPTQCATLTSPANNAANITKGTVALSWTAPAAGPAATSYDVYFGTTSGSLTLQGNTTAMTYNVNASAYATIYYWKITAKSASGGDAAGCTEFHFTTQADPFAPYCSGVTYTSNVEPITSVNFAGINNQSSATVGTSSVVAPLENYLSTSGSVTTQTSYTMTLKGNTDGNFVNYFTIWIDWNHDGLLNAANEKFVGGSITNSTGTDAITAVSTITVPSTALAGVTRMRIQKLYNAAPADPCIGGSFGQSEDYTLNVTICTPVTWYADADGDTFGNPAATQSACNQPVGYVSNSTDCNDANSAIYQNGSFYVDADGDHYDAGIQTVCYGATTPTGYSTTTSGSDCNDANASVYQSASLYIDADADGYNGGTATVCYGAAVPAGYSAATSGSDCNDADATKHQTYQFYADNDNDNYGAGSLTSACAVNGTTPPSGYSVSNTDCNDTNASVYQNSSLYVDADGDHYDAGTQTVCYGATTPSGYSATTNGTDCNDSNATIYQSASLYIDADSDGYNAGTATVCYGATIPTGFSATTIGSDCNDADPVKHQAYNFYADTDGDGYGAGSSVSVCAVNSTTPPSGYSVNNTDCNAANAAVYQSASLYIDADADGYDAGSQTVCYGLTIPAGYSSTTNGPDCDDTNAAVYQSEDIYVDADGDGYDAGSQTVCYGATIPSGYSWATNGNDCNDANASVYQSAILYADADGDGYDNGSSVQCYGASIPSGYSAATNGNDCNDANPSVYQSASLYVDADGDGYDNGTSVQCYGAAIPSGYSATTNGSDCDDADASKHQAYPFYADADGDTYGAGNSISACAVNGTTPPSGYSLNNTDCNDANPSVYQSATLYVDSDGDGYDIGSSVQCYGASIPSGYSVMTNGTDCNDGNASVYQSAVLYIDADGDGYDNGSSVQCYGAAIPSGYSVTTNGSDCDDADATKHQAYPFYADADADTYGAGNSISACAVNGTTPPAGYSLNNTDCNDATPSVYQSATLYVDSDGDGYDNGTSVQCYGASIPSGYSAITGGSDCNDADATKHQLYSFYADADGDTYGAGILVSACAANALTPPAGYSLSNTDCNDANSAAYQTASLYTDGDGDHYTVGVVQLICYGATAPVGYSTNSLGTDCNDANASVYQNGQFYVDADNDGYNNGGSAVTVCYGASAPSGYTLNTGMDCNDAIAAINPGHAEVLYNGVDDNCDGNLDEGNQIKTKLLPESCGATLVAINSLIGITTVSSQITGYRIRVTNGAQVQIIERNVPHFMLPELPNYAYATTYTVEVELQRLGVWLGYYGDPCLISSPAVLSSGGATQISPSQCGLTLPRINTLIATTSLAGVTGYRFRITNLTNPTGANVVQIIDRPLHWFSLQMLAQYNYGTTYSVEVAIKTTGSFGGYGGPCNVTSPATPSLINCGSTIAASTTRIAAASLDGVTQYRFQIINSATQASVTIDRAYNWFTFAMVPGYMPNAVYSIRVAVMTTGTWSPLGDTCQITSPPSVSRHIAEPETAPVNEDFLAVAYPNPFANEFIINLTTSSTDNVGIMVYDMAGRLVEEKQNVANDVHSQNMGARYPAGVYNVIVKQGDHVKAFKLIKR